MKRGAERNLTHRRGEGSIFLENSRRQDKEMLHKREGREKIGASLTKNDKNKRL